MDWSAHGAGTSARFPDPHCAWPDPDCYLADAPGCRGTAEFQFEGARKRFAGTEARRQGNVQYRFVGAAGQPQGGRFQAPAARIVAQRFAHPGGEHAVKVEARKMRDVCQLRQVQRRVEMAVDMIEHGIHAPRIFGAELATALATELARYRLLRRSRRSRHAADYGMKSPACGLQQGLRPRSRPVRARCASRRFRPAVIPGLLVGCTAPIARRARHAGGAMAQPQSQPR